MRPASPSGSDLAGDVPEGPQRARAHQAYAQESRRQLEDRLILDHLPLVRHVVRKVAGHLSGKVDVEDLISAGTLGLVKAAKAFDPTKDVEFKTYAYIRIRGAVIDELRGLSFGPSGVHSQVKQAEQVYQRLTVQNGAPPTDEELAAALGISPGQLYKAFEDSRRAHFLSIHGLSDESPTLGRFLPPAEGPDPASEAERNELLARLAEAVRKLPQRDRLVLLLYYERDLTMKEAAEVLGVTESRVSQLHASALFKLSLKLRDAL